MQLQRAIRWKSGNNNKPSEAVEAKEAIIIPKAATPTKSSSSSAPIINTEQPEQRIKRVVTDLNLGDQLSVILIVLTVLLTVLILTAPFVIQQMKKSDTEGVPSHIGRSSR